MNSLAPNVERLWQERLAQLSATLLRGSRLSLLLAASGASRSTLLRHGVLPLLGRRAIDHVTASGAAAPACRPADAPERRAGNVGAEVVVMVERWSDAPLDAWVEALRRALPDGAVPHVVASSLADVIGAAASRFGVRFLFVFDAFEEALDRDAAALDDFADELARAAHDPTLRAHFLLALRDDQDPRLARFRGRIRGFGQHFVRMPETRDKSPTGALPDAAAAPRGPSSARAGARSPTPPPAGPTQWNGDPPPAPRSSPVSARTPRSAAAPGPRGPREGFTPTLEPRTSSEPVRTRRRIAVGAAIASAASALVVMLATVEAPMPPRSAGSAAASSSMPSAPAPPLLPPLAIAVASADHRRLVEAFAAALPPQAGMRVVADPVAGGVELLDRIGSDGDALPPYAIVRHDLLEVLRNSGGGHAVRVVTPLLLEAVHAVVRADSPWKHLHQIGTLKIDYGPIGSTRFATATALYERLFGRAVDSRRSQHRDDADALRALLAGDGADVVLLVGPAPLDVLTRLSADDRRRLALLGVDRSHPSSSRALRTFLPVSIDALDGGAAVPAFASMSYLVGAADGDDADRLLAFGLCRAAPALRASGHPPWRDVRLGADLPAPVPVSRAAGEILGACEGGRTTSSSARPVATLASPLSSTSVPQGARR